MKINKEANSMVVKPTDDNVHRLSKSNGVVLLAVSRYTTNRGAISFTPATRKFHDIVCDEQHQV